MYVADEMAMVSLRKVAPQGPVHEKRALKVLLTSVLLVKSRRCSQDTTFPAYCVNTSIQFQPNAVKSAKPNPLIEFDRAAMLRSARRPLARSFAGQSAMAMRAKFTSQRVSSRWHRCSACAVVVACASRGVRECDGVSSQLEIAVRNWP